MTRKDYVLIAEVLREREYRIRCNFDSKVVPYVETERANIVEALAHALWKDNPRFDSRRFFKACAVEGRD